MKAFLGLDASGNLISTHTHRTWKTGLGGWSEEFDLDNPNSANPDVAEFKAAMRNKNIVQWVAYDCPCPPTNGTCSCASARRVDHRWDGNSLVAKPQCGLLVDGAPYVPDSVIDRAPEQELLLKVAGAEVPNDATVSIIQDDQPRLLDTSERRIELTFQDGETGEVSAYAPAQGMVGRLLAYGPYTAPLKLRVRGWQTA